MAQSYNLGALGQFLTVNGASNTATFANAVSVGNASVNVTINSTAFTGQANNALYLGGTIASGYLTTAGVNANIAAYLPTYTGAVNGSSYTISTTFIANTTGVYHTGLVNAASHTVGTSTIANATGVYTGVVNGASHTVGTIFIANATAVTINTIPITYGTTGAAAPTLTTRSTGTKFVLYDSLSGSTVDYAIGVEGGYQWQSWPGPTQGLKWYSGTSQVMLANTTGLYYTGLINATSFTVSSSLIGNATGVYHTGTMNAASHTVGSTFIANTSQVTITTPLSANASTGTSGYVLTSNGASGSPYWAAAAPGTNTAAQYAWTNTHTFSANVTINSTSDLIIANGAGIQANGSFGTAGDVLTSNGTGTYWAAASGGGGGGLSPSDYVVQGKLTSDQSITGGGDVIIQFVDDFDPQNWWDASTYRFTPTVAGYYEVKLAVWWTASSANTGQNNIQARKGGSTFMILQMDRTSVNARSVNGSKLVYLNGSSDYVDFTAYADVTQSIQYGGTSSGQGSWFSATLIAYGSTFTGGTVANATTFSANVTLSAPLIANGSPGTATYVLTSNGSTGSPYWAVSSGGGGGSFTNGASIAVSNLAYTSTTANSVGVAYSFINTTSNSIDTVFA